MQWNDIYKTGIESIDEQHKGLFAAIGSFQKAVNEGKGTEHAGETLKMVVDYTQHHFSDEELIMSKSAFTDLRRHTILHKNIIKEIKATLLSIKKKKEFDTAAFSSFLSKWLTNHILTEDMKLASHIEKKRSEGVF